MQQYGLTWFDCQRKPKYMGDEYVDEVRLQSQFPGIYRTVVLLGLRFIFNHPGDCNLSLVHEFYANWLTETKYKIVPIRGKDVKFSARILNELLGTLNCDADDFNRLKEKPPYRDIQHTLCGVELTARWTRSNDTGRHSTLHFANFNLIARVWLKIVCSVLLPAKHLTEGIEEEACDLTIAFHPDLTGKLVDVTRTKALDTSHGHVLSSQERQARDDSVMTRMFGMAELQLRIGDRHVTNDEMETMTERYPLTESAAFLCKTGPAFLEHLDDDEATVNEAMDDEEDDVVDGEDNRLKEKPPYRDIQHTLCGVELTARWTRSNDTGRHSTLHFANFNLIARVWLKIVCSVLLPAKHLTEGIEEEACDLTIAFHPDLTGKLVDVTRTKALDTSHGHVLSSQERQARDDSVMTRMFGMAELQLRIGDRHVTNDEMETMTERYPLTESAAFLCKTGPAFLEHLDDDEATVNEAMDDEEDDVVDGEENALMVFDGSDDEA
uniref:Putative plant transposon protein domain-containing protein n=1 Tax=Solanum tuberosum TaxID=4113 RepID=M1DXM9_SOLTU